MLNSNNKLLLYSTEKHISVVPVSAAVVVLALAVIGAAGVIVYKKKKGEREKWMISVFELI